MSKGPFQKEEASVISVRKNLKTWKQADVSYCCFLPVCLLSWMERRVLPVCVRRLLGPTKQLCQRSHVRDHESAVVPPTVRLQMPTWIHGWDAIPICSSQKFRNDLATQTLFWGKLVMGWGMSDCVWGKFARRRSLRLLWANEICLLCFGQ